MSTVVLYSRVEDGGRAVEVITEGKRRLFKVLGGGEHRTARSLLEELTSCPRARRWSLKRYFKRSLKEAREEPGGLLALFGASSGVCCERSALAPSWWDVRASLWAEFQSKAGRGICLQTRSGEVRKILYAGFGGQMVRSGYDPEEVLQEVYRKILTANRGRNPWDPARCSFGHYVHMVCGSALKNHHRKCKRVADREVLGASHPSEEDGLDVAQVAVAPQDLTLGLQTMVESLGAYIEKTQPEDAVRDLILRVLIPGLVGGETRREMVVRSGVSLGVLQKAMTRLRESTRVWQAKESGF